MSERVCIRGCAIPGRHLVPHDVSDQCNGCLPKEATHGSYLCDRCSRRLRRMIMDAPDLCSHLRSLVDPAKSTWNFTQPKPTFDGHPVKRPVAESRPPEDTDIIDASDEVLGILAYWAQYFGDEMDYRGRRSFPAGSDSVDAFYLAWTPAGFLLDHFDRVVNDSFVRLFAEKVLGPAAEDDWTIAKALGRWSLHERSRWAVKPCPECALRAVRVRPPRVFGDPTEFWCTNQVCEWEAPERDLGLWADYFGVSEHVHQWESDVVNLGPRVFSCACGAEAIDTASADEPPALRVTKEAEPEQQEPQPDRELVGVRHGTRRIGELNLTGLDRDRAAAVCGKCHLLMPCGCEETAA